MDKKVKYLKTAAAVLAFVALLGGAYFLYDTLSEKYSPGQDLVIEDGQADLTPEADGSPDQDDSEEPGDGQDDGDGTLADEDAGSGADSSVTLPEDFRDFTVQDADGNDVKLSSFVGKPIILNFWASWCPPCKLEMPDFDEAYAEYGGDIEFIMVNVTDGSRETVETAEEFIEDAGYSFPVYFDTQLEAANAYMAYSIPVTYFFDSSGELTASGRGMMSAETIQKGIDMILK